VFLLTAAQTIQEFGVESDLIAWLSLAAVLLLMSGAAAAEVALASADRADLRRKAESGDAASARAEALLESPARLLLTTTVVKNLGMVSVGGLLLFVLSDELPLSQVALLLLLVGLVVSTLQLVARRVVSRGAIAVALRAAPFVQLLALLLTPLFYLLHRFGIDIDDDEGSTSDESVFLSEEGLRHLIDVNDESAELEDSEREMIAGILEMDETVVREVMKPRVDMVSLPVDTTLQHALDVIIAAGHSRIPVYEDDLDLIVGVLYAKDLLRCFRDQQADVAIRDILRPAYFVPVSHSGFTSPSWLMNMAGRPVW
jgi:CBS domain containing-hemolysin-like protein